MARFYARSRLSERKSLTPEGYLLCLDVPLARTGALDYTADEVPEDFTADKDGLVTVHRSAADLFDPAAMASFEGKPVTLGHPEDDVSPETWRDLAVGHAQNVRQGSGADADLLLADILITDAEAIKAVEDGLAEISLGYDTEYTEISPGVGKQTRLRGNHIALVEAGRCGPRCAVRDEGPKSMKNPLKGLVAAIRGNPALRKAVDANPKVKKALDEAIAEEVKDEEVGKASADEEPEVTTDGDENSEMLILLRSINEKLDKLSGTTADEDSCAVEDGGETKTDDENPVITEDEESDPPTQGQQDRRSGRKTADAATVASARRLAPGLSVRVGDNAIAVKRAALASACRDEAVRRVVDSIVGRPGINGVGLATLSAAFVAADAVARDRASRRTADTLSPSTPVRDTAPVTPAELNAMYAAHRKGES